MREYLDLVVKAYHFAQNVDDPGIAANNVTDLTRNIRAVFGYFCKVGLKLTVEKWDHFTGRSFTTNPQN